MSTYIVIKQQIMKQFSLEEYLANPAKKVVTRSGKDVRILCTDAKGDFPIIALIDELTDNCIYHSVYTKEGHVKPYDIPTRYDLFFAPEKHEGWVKRLGLLQIQCIKQAKIILSL